MKLFEFQQKGLDRTDRFNKVAYYWEMGTGKTFVGSAKMARFGSPLNLVVCQKSKIDDWVQHLKSCGFWVCDLTDKKQYDGFFEFDIDGRNYGKMMVGVINYDLLFRREDLTTLTDFTLLLDESSLIQNEKSKRARFVMMKLHYKNLILLSGTPCSGKYEKLWSQLRLLGWQISKSLFWNEFIRYRVDKRQGFPLLIVTGYKNVDRLKEKMRLYGCDFLKTDEVIDLPEQTEIDEKVKATKEYATFREKRIVEIDGTELVGDTTLTKMLCERLLCGMYCQDKLNAFEDLLNSTEDRLIVFYNFNAELKALEDICIKNNRPMSIVNGKMKDLKCYEEYNDSVTLIQYQAGAMGLNLQKANKIIYFTPPLSSELYEQSKKRTHRIGQKNNCFYWKLICKGSVEEKIYKVLAMRKDYTDALYEQEESAN
mgnify:CR=1 FL=1